MLRTRNVAKAQNYRVQFFFLKTTALNAVKYNLEKGT